MRERESDEKNEEEEERLMIWTNFKQPSHVQFSKALLNEKILVFFFHLSSSLNIILENAQLDMHENTWKGLEYSTLFPPTNIEWLN